MEITVNRNLKPNLSGLNTSHLNDNLNDDEFAFTRAEKIKLAHLSTGSTGGGSLWESVQTGGTITYTSQPIDYGRYYNGYTASSPNLAPEGWHVPTSNEWQTLIDNFGTASSAGARLKESGTNHWDNDTTGDELSGMNLYGGGMGYPALDNDPSINFSGFMSYCYYWCSDISGEYDVFSGDTGYNVYCSSTDNSLYVETDIRRYYNNIRLIRNEGNLETEFVDVDGNIYTSIELSGQTWSLQNFASTKYNDGTPINSDFPISYDETNEYYSNYYLDSNTNSGSTELVYASGEDIQLVVTRPIGDDPIHLAPKDNKRIFFNIIDGFETVNNLDTVIPGSALDAAQGRILKDLILSLPTGSTGSTGDFAPATGNKFITVKGSNSNPGDNGLELVNAYNLAKTMSLSPGNEVNIIIYPGYYGLNSPFILDTPYINLISSTGSLDVRIGFYGITVNTDNIKLYGIWFSDGGLSILGNHPNLWIENCSGQIMGDNTNNNTILSGTFKNIKVISNGFIQGFSGFTGHFEDIYCDMSNGGVPIIRTTELFTGIVGSLSGTFINCHGGSSSFYSKNLTGKFYNCSGISNSFHADQDTGDLSGEFYNCSGGAHGFSGFYLTGTFDNCVGDNPTFVGNHLTGKFYNCIGGDGSFNSYSGDLSGKFHNCTGTGNSFSSGPSGLTGTFYNCVSDTGFDVIVSGTLVGCTLTVGAFPVPLSGGTLNFCVDANTNRINIPKSKTPTSANASGNKGDICYDDTYMYICVEVNTWKKITLTSL